MGLWHCHIFMTMCHVSPIQYPWLSHGVLNELFGHNQTRTHSLQTGHCFIQACYLTDAKFSHLSRWIFKNMCLFWRSNTRIVAEEAGKVWFGTDCAVRRANKYLLYLEILLNTHHNLICIFAYLHIISYLHIFFCTYS